MAATKAAGGKAKGAAGQHSADFDQAIAACQKTFRESQGRGWEPPDGDYGLLLKAAEPIKAGKTKDGTAYQLSQTVTFEIIGGDMDGKSFRHTFRTRSDKTIAGEWKQLASIVSGGDEVGDIQACADILISNAGQVGVATNVSRNEWQGRTFVNYNFQRLLDMDAGDGEAPADDEQGNG